MFNTLFRSFDQALRDVGVGDLSVGKRIRKMAEAFYGRAGAYREALDKGDDAALEEALRRNLLAGASEAPGFIAALSEHVRATVRQLDAVGDAELLVGRLALAPLG
jgi:cytochrome b pre-mRNA-processing protein 3